MIYKLAPKKRRRGDPPPELPPSPTLELEREWRARGFELLAGLDEAGRGAWAGPVVAAAVILPPGRDDLPQALAGLRDSKKMTARQRERLFDVIHNVALALGVGTSNERWIDSHGILAATKTAMRDAVLMMNPQPEALLIDAVDLTQMLDHSQQSLYYGDSISLSIAAASVIAKVCRDLLMVKYDGQYPGYNFAQHKGYGTPGHRQALDTLGVCTIHRRSFKPVAARLAAQPALQLPLEHGPLPA